MGFRTLDALGTGLLLLRTRGDEGEKTYACTKGDGVFLRCCRGIFNSSTIININSNNLEAVLELGSSFGNTFLRATN